MTLVVRNVGTMVETVGPMLDHIIIQIHAKILLYNLYWPWPTSVIELHWFRLRPTEFAWVQFIARTKAPIQVHTRSYQPYL